jgi:hypothetical protein
LGAAGRIVGSAEHPECLEGRMRSPEAERRFQEIRATLKL